MSGARLLRARLPVPSGYPINIAQDRAIGIVRVRGCPFTSLTGAVRCGFFDDDAAEAFGSGGAECPFFDHLSASGYVPGGARLVA
jgi:hypothetical protein